MGQGGKKVNPPFLGLLFFVLLRPSVDWMKPTQTGEALHITEPTNSNVRLIPEITITLTLPFSSARLLVNLHLQRTESLAISQKPGTQSCQKREKNVQN